MHPASTEPVCGQAIDSAQRRRIQWLAYALLIVLAAIIRMPALPGEMVWDDTPLVRDNPLIKSPLFIFEVFRHHLFLDSFSAHYRPVQNLSFIVDYFFWGSDVYGFHLTNVLLHVASGVLLYNLLRKLFSSLAHGESNAAFQIAAFGVALLWVVHPVHSAAVDYISGRADSLSFIFACGGWLLFLRGQAAPNRKLRIFCYITAAIAGLFSLCSREIGFVWMLLFLIHTNFFHAKFRTKRFALTATCVLLIIFAYIGCRHLPNTRPVTQPSNEWPVTLRAVLMLRSLGDYARLMVYPGNLHMERTVFSPAPFFNDKARWQMIDLEYLSIAGLLTLAAFWFGALRKGNGQRLRIFGVLWFLLAYLPISNLVELNATVAEHWLYLPSVGFLIFVAGCALAVPPRYHKILIAGGACAVLALAARSAIRSSDWATEEAFYQRTLAAGGMSARVLGNLAEIYSRKGDYTKAERMFRLVLKMSPEYPIARNNLAEALARQGKHQEAEEILASTSRETAQTRKEYPRTWIPVLNLALYRHNAKDEAGAMAIIEQAQRDYPGTWEIVRLQANLLQEANRPEAALPVVTGFVRDHWWHRAATVLLGRLYSETGHTDKALQLLHWASWLDVYDPEALNVIAEIRLKQNRLAEACVAQRKAISRQPDQPRQYAFLCKILEKMGRDNEARLAMAQTARLKALAQNSGAPN